LAAAPQIVYCPPMPAQGVVVQKPFAHRQSDVVNGTNGISFGDYKEMHVRSHTIVRQRILPDAGWPFNEVQRRHVILTFMKKRALAVNPLKIPIEGTEREQLLSCCLILRSQVPVLSEILDRLCRESVQTLDPERRRVLEKEILITDRRLCLAQHPDVFERLVYLHFNCGLDALAVSLDTNLLSPVGIRMLVSRLNATARALGYEVPKRVWRGIKRVPKPPRLCPCGAQLFGRQRHYCLKCKAEFMVRRAQALNEERLREHPPKPVRPVVLCSVCGLKPATWRRRFFTCSAECSAIRNEQHKHPPRPVRPPKPLKTVKAIITLPAPKPEKPVIEAPLPKPVVMC